MADVPVGDPIVGVLDSGVGGLTVWREIVRLMPSVSTLYVADTAHCPYGIREAGEVRQFVLSETDWLFDNGCDAVVLACNTATAVAVSAVRAAHSARIVIGMEPAIKPAAAQTRTGVVGVLATARTLQGDLFRRTSSTFARNVRVRMEDAGDWVPLVEAGIVRGERAEAAVARHVAPLVAEGVDVAVLGCTHFPFLVPEIRRQAPGLCLLDPAPAVARQLRRRLVADGWPEDRLVNPYHIGHRRFVATGAPVDWTSFLALLERGV